MAGDVRERIDPELDLRMEQNGALKRFFVVVFFHSSFSYFYFYLSHKLRLFGGKEGLCSLSPPFSPPKPSQLLQTQGIHKLLPVPLPLVPVGLMKIV